MRLVTITACLILAATAVFAQGNTGSITGTVSDPANAVIAGAPVTARNIGTGALYTGASTLTGNYTLVDLPPGDYEVTVTAPGFKTFIRGPLTLSVRQTMRIDAPMEVGNTTEAITVTDAAPLLITESAEIAYNVDGNRINELPVGNMGSVRNIVRSAALLMPGVQFGEGFFGGVVVNGTPSDGYNLRIDGMDNTYGLGNLLVSQVQPSVEAIEEYAINTSNFAAELGQIGGSVFSVTMKSGTNDYHGSAFDYYANDAFYAAHPYTKQKSAVSNTDWGFTIGGPVSIPKVYNGRDKTFFFFSYETRPQSGTNVNTYATVPTPEYRMGDLSAAITAANSKVLGQDALGRDIIQNQVYDPASTFTNNGQLLRNPFPNNQIPVSRFDPVAANVLSLVPNPTQSGLIQNYNNPYATGSTNYLPSFKIDHNINSSHKLSFFYSYTAQRTQQTTAEGLPSLISAFTKSSWTNKNYRINYDWTVTPTILLHLGVGMQDAVIGQLTNTTPYNATTQLGLQGPFTPSTGSTFPAFSGLTSGAYGGLNTLGSTAFNGNQLTKEQKPTAVANLTWVKGNHTYKFGGELRIDGYPTYNLRDLNGQYAFSAAETALPYLQTTNVGGNSIGFPFASFLLGQVNSGNVSVPAVSKLGQHSLGLYVQDTWKVTRKLTLDYGLRWDYATYQKEQYGRYPTLDPTAPLAAAGGHPGATTYEATCGCHYSSNYPYGWGPRLGAAYQINQKTVLRGGFGIVYNTTARIGIAGRSITSTNPFAASVFGQPAMVLGQGVPLTLAQIQWPNFDPNYYPIGGSVPGNANGNVFDQNAGKPARQYQWSIGLQREIFRDLVVEASYVGNRGIWWPSTAGVNYNANQVPFLGAKGLDLNNPADVSLLTMAVGSPQVVARGFGLPFTGFPANRSLASSLLPYPQYTGGLTPRFAPLGKTWYDSLQVKATKRLSYGLSMTYSFTFGKALDFGNTINDVFNRTANKNLQSTNRKFQNVIAFTYTVPKMNGINSILSYVLADWQVSSVLQYASGFPIPAPSAQNNLNTILFQGNTRANRVPGQPLFLKDLNSGNVDPKADFVLNPAAWTDPAKGQFGTAAAFYSDYTYQRRPMESMNFARNFRITEGVRFQVRMEFTNVFNRAQPANPDASNANLQQARNGAGVPTGGFGRINYTQVGQQPRNGQLVMRLTF